MFKLEDAMSVHAMYTYGMKPRKEKVNGPSYQIACFLLVANGHSASRQYTCSHILKNKQYKQLGFGVGFIYVLALWIIH